MNELYPYPAYLPDQYCRVDDWWIGARDPYGPQLSVVKGPEQEAVIRACNDRFEIEIHFEARTGDMGEDEPSDDLETFIVIVEKVFVGEHGELHFLGNGKLPYIGDGIIWIWDYSGNGEGAGADLLVTD